MQQAFQTLYQAPQGVPNREALNGQSLKEVIYWARFEGAQIRIDGETVYSGADFPTDTSSADGSLAEIWKRRSESFIQRLRDALTRSGAIVSILWYRNGVWFHVKSILLL